MATEAKKRVISGMRPTGRLHIGHYFGALQNWVRLQNDRAFDCFYFIADWHALTSDYADTAAIAQNVIEITTDYLAAGLDPDKHKNCTIFQQSLVPEHAELHLLLSMVTPLGWLERVPTYKEALENIKDKDLHTYGFLGYPTLQTADIVMYSQPGTPLVVPVGEDQVSHVELSREIVRRFSSYNAWKVQREKLIAKPAVASSFFNYLVNHYRVDVPEWVSNSRQLEAPPAAVLDWIVRALPCVASEAGIENVLAAHPEFKEFVEFRFLLAEPEHQLTQTPRIPGLDGRKMSKSYGNAITLSESDADIRAKTKVMVTDPARKRRTDPGNPDVCPVYDWHKLFSSPETLKWSAEGCRTAGIGCIECKAKMADHLIAWITPVRDRRVEYEKHPKRVLEVIDEGSKKARAVAQETMERVREAVFGWERKRKEVAGS